jgi:lauroyl/myristoyl acyltransferase/tetraacyldisaccharide-1-P 4'-kinase
VNFLLAPWRAVNRVRRAMYRAGVFRAKRLHRPVISIGNIAAGGTGKTPAVIAVCRFLESRGLRVTVLSRGYGRSQTTNGIVTAIDADKYGDEPILIKTHTKADIIVGKTRYDNARDHETDVFVLDDGFQHLQLRRDFDLVIDAPAKYYREGRSALRHADAVIPRRLRTLVPDSLRGQRVVAFAGLADNEQFFAALREAGVLVETAKSFPDHHRYTPADLDALRRHGLPLVTTEKDKVKIADRDVIAVGAVMDIDRDVLEQLASVATGERTRERKPKRRKNPLLQRIEYAAYRFVARRVLSMSADSLSRWGARLGNLGKRILRGRDRLGMRNLRYVYPDRPEQELRRILDECWRHFGRETLLSVQTQNLSLEELAERVPFHDFHHVEESIARGKGTLIISAHWGGWEAAGLALMARVRNVLTVARPLDNELLERELQQIRARTGAEVVDRRKAARALLRGLTDNAVVVLLPDQAVLPREGVLVPFLGRPAWTTPAPAKMAIRAGSTIVFGFCIPHGLRQRVEFEEPIQTEAGMDAEELTARINAVIARRIHERPELWLWMHDRWKGTGEKET